MALCLRTNPGGRESSSYQQHDLDKIWIVLLSTVLLLMILYMLPKMTEILEY